MNTVARSNVEQLLAEARQGEAECLGKLLQYYGNYLKLLVTAHLDAKLRARCSPSDIVQESYFEAHRDFEKFQGRTAAEFLAWLRKILVNNIAREVEKHILSAKRNVRREVRLDGMQTALERSAARLESVFVDQASSPSSRVDWRVLKTSLVETPNAIHFVRSISRCSQGVLACRLLNTPCRPGVALDWSTILSLTRCKSPSPKLPRSSIMIFNPPVVPGPLARWPAQAEPDRR